MKNILKTLLLMASAFTVNAQQTIVETFEYDEVGRLIKAAYDNVSDIIYSYDMAGNLVHAESTIETSSTYDVLDYGQVKLFQNVPNPSLSGTLITYYLPTSDAIELVLFNTLGQELWIVDQGEKSKGFHEVSLDDAFLKSGIYTYQLRLKDFSITKKMIKI